MEKKEHGINLTLLKKYKNYSPTSILHFNGARGGMIVSEEWVLQLSNKN